jgi:hypothetical protein
MINSAMIISDHDQLPVIMIIIMINSTHDHQEV